MHIPYVSSRRQRYTALSDQDENQDKAVDTRDGRHRSGRTLFPQCLLMVTLIVVGYLAGSYTSVERNFGLLAPAGNIDQELLYNRNFSMAPTEESPRLWQRLFPDNGGFIHHPVIATNFSGIAVFHQLHCLHALYRAHYSISSDEHRKIEMEKKHIRTDSHGSDSLDPKVHVRHCFDYLRQSLMCQADTNLEAYNFRLDGSTGWGLKKCRDYDSVIKFANAWGGSKYAIDHDERS